MTAFRAQPLCDCTCVAQLRTYARHAIAISLILLPITIDRRREPTGACDVLILSKPLSLVLEVLLLLSYSSRRDQINTPMD
jgi:hypothetical protein